MARKYTLFIFILWIIHQTSAGHLSVPAEGPDSPADVSLTSQKIPSVGEFKGLVILAEFSDTPFTVPDPTHRFWAMLNMERYGYQGAKGCVRDYFITNSDSLFFPGFDVVGPVKLSKPMNYYGQNGENGEEIHAGEMVTEACRLAASEVDFSGYDSNNDGQVDLVYIFFASYCENENQHKPEYIWAHAGSVADSCLTLHNKTIARYACSSEYIGKDEEEQPQMATIGTFCHEFSHVLGLPDFYNTLSGSGLTPGSLSLMDRGNYLDNGRCPAGYSAFEKEFVGWTEIPAFEPCDSALHVSLHPVSSTTGNSTMWSAFKIGIPGTKEYFYMENRQAENWDRYLPATGLFIYRVDLSDEEAWDRNLVNTNASHPYYEVIRYTVYAKIDYPYIPFPGKDNKTFFSSPPAWNGKDAGFELQSIEERDSQVSLQLIRK